jgi:hypothetical protein
MKSWAPPVDADDHAQAVLIFPAPLTPGSLDRDYAFFPAHFSSAAFCSAFGSFRCSSCRLVASLAAGSFWLSRPERDAVLSVPMGLWRDLLWKLGGSGVRRKMLDEALNQWRIVKIENEKLGTVIMKLRVEKPSLPDESEFRTAISVDWPYGSGLPDVQVKTRMDAFEVGVDELTSENGFAELVLVRMGLGVRTWLFYSSDPARFRNRFDALTLARRYPLRITVEDDPDWKLWREIVDDVGVRDSASER